MTTRKSTTKKTTASKAKPRPVRAKKRATPRPASKRSASRRAPKKAEEPEVIRALTTLPERLNEITYVAQTRSILERRQRRVARLRSDTRRELLGVLHDIQGDAKHQLEKVQSDLRSRAESVWARCAKTKLGHEVEQVPERVTELADQWLDKVGLVRKARLAS